MGQLWVFLNIAYLRDAYLQGFASPEIILNESRRLVIENIKNDSSEEGGEDGFDTSLNCFNPGKERLTLSGTNNPI